VKFFNAAESANALQCANSGTSMGGPELRADFSACLDRSAALARLLATLLGKDQPCLLWIREFGIWPSLENLNLFSCLRASSGEFRSLAEAPGHEFGANELAILISYLQVVLLSGWGGVLIGFGNQHRIAISHDSWISIRSSKLPSQTALVNGFGLPNRLDQEPQSLAAA